MKKFKIAVLALVLMLVGAGVASATVIGTHPVTSTSTVRLVETVFNPAPANSTLVAYCEEGEAVLGGGGFVTRYNGAYAAIDITIPNKGQVGGTGPVLEGWMLHAAVPSTDPVIPWQPVVGYLRFTCMS